MRAIPPLNLNQPDTGAALIERLPDPIRLHTIWTMVSGPATDEVPSGA